jgi:hypothetical protein
MDARHALGWVQVILAGTILSAACGSGKAEFVLTAEVTPIAGLTGFASYRLTATSDLGNIVCFDFSRAGSYGITGPMNQVNPYGQQTVFGDSFLDNYDRSLDTQFLLNGSDLLQLFPEESSGELHAAFALLGDKQRTIGNSVPFVQIATSSSMDVMLKGVAVVRRPNDEFVQMTSSSK